MSKISQPQISIVIRTFNEERWIGHCLKAIYDQSFKDFEIIIVDNCSTDHTLQIINRYPIKKIVSIKNFVPGLAINKGVELSLAKFIVCVSAHCIPKNNNWLKCLIKNFNSSDVAAAYGRQLPLSFTNDLDKRDLLITFGQDKKIQIKDYFFHNANSIFLRELWEKKPFCNESTNIEDRIWAKNIIKLGYKIIYDPDASVYHYHGLHHHKSKSSRAAGIATILNQIDKESVGDLPKSMKPENADFAVIIPVLKEHIKIYKIDLLDRAIKHIKKEKYVNNIYILTNIQSAISVALKNKVSVIPRPSSLDDTNIAVGEVLKFALEFIEKNKFYPEALVYVNYLYPFPPNNLIKKIIEKLQYDGLDTVFSSFPDYGNFWKDHNGDFEQIENALKPRSQKAPLHKALYGLGCVTRSCFLRKGKFVGDNLGILPLNKFIHTLRVDRDTPRQLIGSILKNK
jgi:rhamnosyltransferase